VKGWSLGVALCLAAGCYEGPQDNAGGSSGDETTGPGDSSPPTGSGNPTGPTDPTTGASDPTSATSPPQTSGSTDDSGGSTNGPADSGDSTSGTMSGCEAGPLAEPIPGCAPAPLPSTGDIHQDCVDRINQFRWECQCLPPLARWSDAEACSDDQSSLDQNGGGPHGNFGMCGENAQNTCPNWGSEQQIINGCLQSMWDEGPGEPFSEHGHYINMSSTNYTRVACGFSYDGGVWSNQNFSP
jgi:hypothetical protein